MDGRETAASGSKPPIEARPHCRECGYNLTGLAVRGVCPECATPFSPELRDFYAKRPPFGRWLLLAQPGMIPPVAITIFAMSPSRPGWAALIGVLTLAICPVFSVIIAIRLARWRYTAASLAQGRPVALRNAFVANRVFAYLLIQWSLSVATLLALLAAFERLIHKRYWG